jgi:hypothetical protein
MMVTSNHSFETVTSFRDRLESSGSNPGPVGFLVYTATTFTLKESLRTATYICVSSTAFLRKRLNRDRRGAGYELLSTKLRALPKSEHLLLSWSYLLTHFTHQVHS